MRYVKRINIALKCKHPYTSALKINVTINKTLYTNRCTIQWKNWIEFISIKNSKCFDFSSRRDKIFTYLNQNIQKTLILKLIITYVNQNIQKTLILKFITQIDVFDLHTYYYTSFVFSFSYFWSSDVLCLHVWMRMTKALVD